MFQANTPQSIRESWSSALLLLFLYLGGAKKAAIAKHQVTYCLWCQFKIWITQFHGTKNINFICNSYARSSRLLSAPCAGAQNGGHVRSSHVLTLWPRQNWKLPWWPAEGTFYFIHSHENNFPENFFLKIYKSCDLLLLSIRLFPLKSPGPAAYKVVDPCIYGKKPPQYSMTGRNFTAGETTQKPGPGAHYPEKVLIMSHLITTQATNVFHFVDLLTFFSSQVTLTKGKAPSFSFGLRHSQYISPLIVDVAECHKWSLISTGNSHSSIE